MVESKPEAPAITLPKLTHLQNGPEPKLNFLQPSEVIQKHIIETQHALANLPSDLPILGNYGVMSQQHPFVI